MNQFLEGELQIEHYITHKVVVFMYSQISLDDPSHNVNCLFYQFDGLAGINSALEAMHEGSCLRAVVKY